VAKKKGVGIQVPYFTYGYYEQHTDINHLFLLDGWILLFYELFSQKDFSKGY